MFNLFANSCFLDNPILYVILGIVGFLVLGVILFGIVLIDDLTKPKRKDDNKN